MVAQDYTRDTWKRKTDFVLSMLGFCVGLGNVCRFPYLAYDTGGGAFLVPYFLMLIFAGIPLMFLEMSFGQYASQGVISLWNAVPCMRGIGIGILIAMTLAKVPYMMITAYCFHYLFASFKKKLPWVGCHNDWNTVYCSELLKECLNHSSLIVANGSCVLPNSITSSELRDYGVQELSLGNYDFSNYTDPFDGQRVRPSEEYWRSVNPNI
ncbi:sodium-dependent alanine transporter 1 [Apostichopus japonicus]|uniref:Sodium-dependent alanine transporter 1 n=1 Tax=Stichopus japonicus TaxID=307972 RepID=A0A2G8KA28_STIJA|nr:sodium-dependent alanine transporter 1 [Apostichopus japonicus]